MTAPPRKPPDQAIELNEEDQARFWSKVALPNEQGCMLWMTWKNNKGYGQFSLRCRHAYAHRVSYVLAYGPIPDGLVIDHLCRNPACVAPEHLEAVTQSENQRRGNTGGWQKRETRCPNGHLYSEVNTRHQPNGYRSCRACRRERVRRWRSRLKAAA